MDSCIKSAHTRINTFSWLEAAVLVHARINIHITRILRRTIAWTAPMCVFLHACLELNAIYAATAPSSVTHWHPEPSDSVRQLCCKCVFLVYYNIQYMHACAKSGRHAWLADHVWHLYIDDEARARQRSAPTGSARVVVQRCNAPERDTVSTQHRGAQRDSHEWIEWIAGDYRRAYAGGAHDCAYFAPFRASHFAFSREHSRQYRTAVFCDSTRICTWSRLPVLVWLINCNSYVTLCILLLWRGTRWTTYIMQNIANIV